MTAGEAAFSCGSMRGSVGSGRSSLGCGEQRQRPPLCRIRREGRQQAAATSPNLRLAVVTGWRQAAAPSPLLRIQKAGMNSFMEATTNERSEPKFYKLMKSDEVYEDQSKWVAMVGLEDDRGKTFHGLRERCGDETRRFMERPNDNEITIGDDTNLGEPITLRLTFIRYSMAIAQGYGVTLAIPVPVLNSREQQITVNVLN
uniref:Uncharacterized protein n=1 Tax=Oryza punctata TaxID=4537 RepID=A0A0E0MN57_ORYPU